MTIAYCLTRLTSAARTGSGPLSEYWTSDNESPPTGTGEDSMCYYRNISG